MRYLAFLSLLLVVACNQDNIHTSNPPAEGFKLNASDERAIAIADSVVWAHGGRKAWDNTTYLKWNFFGNRKHVWNKKTGDLIIESFKDSFLIDMNLNTLRGTIQVKGGDLTDQDSLAKYLNVGKELWINDSYWLFLPFKLKDSGVTLKYLGPVYEDNKRIQQISLTFDNVGLTPKNRYVLNIDEDYRIVKWGFFDHFLSTNPKFSNDWTDYKKYGDILLSSGRSNYELKDIAVGDSLARYFE